MSARFFTLVTVSVTLAAVAGGFAATWPQQPRAPKNADQAQPPLSAAPTLAADAAAKHARRTACLKDAKERRLLGAEKTAFLKTCMAAPEGAR